MSTEQDISCDYLIIGGGSAGCVLANRLSEAANHQVVLLDAGRSDRHLFTRVPAGQMLAFPRKDMNWLYLAEPDPSIGNRVEIWPAGKALGGGSAINGMMFVRGHKDDYDHWAALGNEGWSYQELLPYFKRMECNEGGGDAYRGGDGPLSVSSVRIKHPMNEVFIKGAEELGIPFNPDLNGAVQEGVGYCQASQKRGWRHSTSEAYIQPIKDRQNLRIELHALVEQILIEQGRAIGALFNQMGKQRVVRAKKGVVLCAGSIATPKLLMLSGIGPARHLAEHGVTVTLDLPGVGKNLQEHACVRTSAHINQPTLTSDTGPISSLKHGINYLLHGSGPLATAIGHVHALAKTDPALSHPNVQLIFAPLAYDLTESGPKPYTKPAVSAAAGLCRTRSFGEIRLRSTDINDNPVIDYRLLDNPDDVKDLVEGCKMLRRIYQSKAFAPFYTGERLPGDTIQTDAQWEEYIHTTAALMYHPCGTAKMGVDDLAVVDPNLKVRGLEGLWVADASVIPTIPAGNINATCIMIGEKASDLVLQATC